MCILARPYFSHRGIIAFLHLCMEVIMPLCKQCLAIRDYVHMPLAIRIEVANLCLKMTKQVAESSFLYVHLHNTNDSNCSIIRVVKLSSHYHVTLYGGE